ncbi:MAG: preprotein translocase subunit SecY [Marinilabiliaceae bacterium]|nr:preprotein translocase subunit SecY [Bacteroidales bacterium]MDD5815789.1 preprotein translocase subunit SecY [Bacteroidales bacterium]MDY4521748.1 preprotein translocase subunit SecY [Bacteroidales bacterium]
MKKLVETIRNIWKIDELKNRILITLGFLLVYRLGSFVVLPGVNPQMLGNLASQTSNGVMGLLDMFSGGAFSNASILGLGIMPYISASIVVQLLGMVIPYFQRLQRDGESGRNKINQITRLLTVAILLLQAPAYIANLYMQLPPEAFAMDRTLFTFASTVILTAGTMFVMWLGEKITDRGIGNGISLIIMVGIIARLPHSLIAEFADKLSVNSTSGGLLMLLLEFVVLFLVFVGSIALVQATRRIPVQYAKRIEGNKQYGGVRQYIPLKLNAANVMPIIFAQALMFLPVTIAGFANPEGSQGFVATFSDFTGFWYNFTFALLIIVFTYFYTALIMNPQQMAEDMKRNSGYIPGVKPGKKTAEYIDTIMSRITLPGSIMLAIVAILPAFATLAGVDPSFAQFYGGTSLLILVGVVLDTLQQIESYLLMRHYDGLMKSGRIMGRSFGPVAH